MIKKLIGKIKFEVEIQLVKEYKDQIDQYNTNPLKHLIKECDKKVRKIRQNVLRNNRTMNIKYYECYRLMQNGNVTSRAI